MSLSSNKIAFGKQLLEERKACAAWHQQTLTQRGRNTFLFAYNAPRAFQIHPV